MHCYGKGRGSSSVQLQEVSPDFACMGLVGPFPWLAGWCTRLADRWMLVRIWAHGTWVL